MTYKAIYDSIYGSGESGYGFGAETDRSLFDAGFGDNDSIYGGACLSDNDRFELEELRLSGILDGFEEPEFDDCERFAV
ncbi:MAG: hypothetical protein IJK60_04650 [Clostridia bacterium]|nr:hypothetical protein [Clostridia bacterium]